MSTNVATQAQVVLAPARRWMVWAGRALAALVALALVASAAMKLWHLPLVLEMLGGKLGFPVATVSVIGALELTCVVLYAIPRTSVLGALLMTGYLGAAVAAHVRIGEAFVAPLVLGVLVWAALFLRDERVRALLPLRR